jgi:hypothetical protein
VTSVPAPHRALALSCFCRYERGASPVRGAPSNGPLCEVTCQPRRRRSGDITDIDDSDDVPNVRDDDVRNAFDVRDDAAERVAWILQRLKEGVRLKAPAVAEHFKCSVKTAQRDLTSLKDQEKIQYVGAPRTGYYRLNDSAESGQ